MPWFQLPSAKAQVVILTSLTRIMATQHILRYLTKTCNQLSFTFEKSLDPYSLKPPSQKIDTLMENCLFATVL